MPLPTYTCQDAEELFKTVEALERSYRCIVNLKLRLMNSPRFEPCWNTGARHDPYAFTLWTLINGLLIVYRNALSETRRLAREALGQLYITTTTKRFNAWLAQQPECWR